MDNKFDDDKIHERLAENAADNEIAYRQAEEFARHQAEILQGTLCLDMTCYHNQPSGTDIPF